MCVVCVYVYVYMYFFALGQLFHLDLRFQNLILVPKI